VGIIRIIFPISAVPLLSSFLSITELDNFIDRGQSSRLSKGSLKLQDGRIDLALLLPLMLINGFLKIDFLIKKN